MTHQSSDTEIIDAVLRGDSRAFASIMERYAPRVYSMVAGMIGDTAEAQDIAQEVFIKIFRELSSFKGRSSFSTWLFRITYNMTVSAMRRSKNLDTTADDSFWEKAAASEIDDCDDTATPSVDQLYNALDRLSPDERTLISLFYLDGKSIVDIAFIMSISEPNVKTRLFRTRKKLQKIISDDTE